MTTSEVCIDYNAPSTFLRKEIVLDLAEATKEECPAISEQLLDFGVVVGTLIGMQSRCGFPMYA